MEINDISWGLMGISRISNTYINNQLGYCMVVVDYMIWIKGILG